VGDNDAEMCVICEEFFEGLCYCDKCGKDGCEGCVKPVKAGDEWWCSECADASKKGLPHLCPQCEGTKICDVTWIGSSSFPSGTVKDAKCDLCDGQGYTKNRMKPITRVVGWESADE